MHNPKRTEGRRPGRARRAAVAAVKIAVVLALVLALPLVNYNIDPSRLYHTGRTDSLEIQAVSILLQGENAANLSNCNERLIRREYLRQTDRTLDTVVLGSSRGALITGDMLGADRFFNLSVSGATMEDMLGVYGYLRLCGQTPRRVVISVDPWVLNDSFADERTWDAFGDGLLYTLRELLGRSDDRSYSPVGLYDPNSTARTGLWAMSGELKLNLFSIPYFQTALQYWSSGGYAAYSKVVQTDADEGETGIMRADGSYSYPADYRGADEAAIILRAETSLPSSILGLEDYDHLDTENRALFTDFLAALTEEGVEVQLLLQPISPVLYDHMLGEERYAAFFETQAMFESIAEDYGLTIVGSFNPHALGLSADDFYDGYHLKPEQVAVLAAMLAEPTAG